MRNPDMLKIFGGEAGIRTLDGVTSIRALQARALNRTTRPLLFETISQFFSIYNISFMNYNGLLEIL